MGDENWNQNVCDILTFLFTLLLLIGLVGFMVSGVVLLWDIFTAEMPFY